MGKMAECPYCKGRHRTKRAFNRCRDRVAGFKWTKEGIKKRKK